MGDRDLPSDSDSSDEDYAPGGIDNEPVSEDDSANDSNEASEHEDVESEKKRKKTTSRKKSRKKMKSEEIEKVNEEEKQEKTEEKPELSVEEKKQKADALYADFLKDCDPPVKRKSSSIQPIEEKIEKPKEISQKVKVVEEFEFAGEKVVVEKEMDSNSNGKTSVAHSSTPFPSRGRGRGRGAPRGSGGIASILGQIGKKNKLSTLEKSKLDWNSFKNDEGITEELEHHNKGKNGYLERQDFLERADLRQFEIEKNLRATKRSSLR